MSGGEPAIVGLLVVAVTTEEIRFDITVANGIVILLVKDCAWVKTDVLLAVADSSRRCGDSNLNLSSDEIS